MQIYEITVNHVYDSLLKFMLTGCPSAFSYVIRSHMQLLMVEISASGLGVVLDLI